MTQSNITQNESQQIDPSQPKFYIRTFDKVGTEFLYWDDANKQWSKHKNAATYTKSDFDQINIYVLTCDQDHSPCWVNEDLTRTETVYEIACETENCESWVILDEHQPRHQADGYGFTFHSEEDENVKEDHFTYNQCGCKASAEYVLATFED